MEEFGAVNSPSDTLGILGGSESAPVVVVAFLPH